MIDTIKKIAEERLKKKAQKKEIEKSRKSGDMLDPKHYEDSMGLYAFLKKKKGDDDEEEDY